MLSDEPQWVALYTNSRAEKRVADRLTEAGIENYLPLRRVKRHWSDRIKVVEEPLIKSYTFARITARQETSLRNVDGVVWIVAFRGKVATITDEQIEAMRQFVDSEKAVAVYEATSCTTAPMSRSRRGSSRAVAARLSPTARTATSPSNWRLSASRCWSTSTKTSCAQSKS